MPYGSPLYRLGKVLEIVAWGAIVFPVAVGWWGGRKEIAAEKKEKENESLLKEQNSAAKKTEMIVVNKAKKAAELKKPLVLRGLRALYENIEETPQGVDFMVVAGWNKLLENKADFVALTPEALVSGAQKYLRKEGLDKSQ
jgi:hypothetical protein